MTTAGVRVLTVIPHVEQTEDDMVRVTPPDGAPFTMTTDDAATFAGQVVAISLRARMHQALAPAPPDEQASP